MSRYSFILAVHLGYLALPIVLFVAALVLTARKSVLLVVGEKMLRSSGLSAARNRSLMSIPCMLLAWELQLLLVTSVAEVIVVISLRTL